MSPSRKKPVRIDKRVNMMKRIEEQTYYEILEVPPTATVKEIQMAYNHAKKTFRPDSLAVYSLFSEEEINKIQAAIEEAYRILMDEALRESYDQSRLQTSIDQTPVDKKLEKLPEREEISTRKKAPPAYQEPAINIREGTYCGKILKEIRERMEIDLRTISRDTKINIKILEWIEEETLEKLPALVYLKGFLKSYAQSLGLNPQKVVEEYLQSLETRKAK